MTYLDRELSREPRSFSEALEALIADRERSLMAPNLHPLRRKMLTDDIERFWRLLTEEARRIWPDL